MWEGPGTTTSLACRSATTIDWIHNNLHGGGLFIAQGNSGGSAQIAFLLAYYGMDLLDLANLSGGPPPYPISTNGQLNFGEQDQCVVDGELFDESREPMLFGAPLLDYPNTTVRFFIGENEPAHTSLKQPTITMTGSRPTGSFRSFQTRDTKLRARRKGWTRCSLPLGTPLARSDVFGRSCVAQREAEAFRRYCQKLWMGLAQAASFLMPSTKGTPLMTSTIN